MGRAVSHFEGAVKEVDIRLSVNGGDAGHGKKRQRTEITLYTLRNGIVRAEDVEKDMYEAPVYKLSRSCHMMPCIMGSSADQS